jgi:hypothetical protein
MGPSWLSFLSPPKLMSEAFAAFSSDRYMHQETVYSHASLFIGVTDNSVNHHMRPYSSIVLQLYETTHRFRRKSYLRSTCRGLLYTMYIEVVYQLHCWNLQKLLPVLTHLYQVVPAKHKLEVDSWFCFIGSKKHQLLQNLVLNTT